MEKEQFALGASYRVDGFYAFIRNESNNIIIFEQKCSNLDEALSVASREWESIKVK
jgi:hypothetical protein